MKCLSMGLIAALLVTLAAWAGDPVPVPPAPAAEATTRPVRPTIRVFEFEDTVHWASAERLIREIDEADKAGNELLLIRLNTPGGYIDALEDIVRRILAAKTPIVVWIGPSGAKGWSAGFIMLIAADVAAMAPGTSTGAASPVSGSGEDKGESTMMKKAKEAMSAHARSIASRRNRDVETCEGTVRDAKAYSDTEALEKKIIDLVAKDQADLLRQLDGRTVRRFDGTSITLRTANPEFTQKGLSVRDRFTRWLADPTVSYVLLFLGIGGLMVEFNHPGLIVPGVVGLICLILFAFSSAILPVSIIGVLLIAGAIVMFVLELKIASFGLLTVGGLVSLVVGSLLLFEGPIPEMRLTLSVVLPVSLVLGGACILALRLALQAHRAKVSTGVEGIVGETGEVSVDLDPSGKVFVHGEIWDAVGPAGRALAKGARVRIARVDGFQLHVEPVEAPPGGGPVASAQHGSGSDGVNPV